MTDDANDGATGAVDGPDGARAPELEDAAAEPVEPTLTDLGVPGDQPWWRDAADTPADTPGDGWPSYTTPDPAEGAPATTAATTATPATTTAQPGGDRARPPWLLTVVLSLVSALIGGGVVAAIDAANDDDGATGAAGSTNGGRNSSVITRTSDVQSILARVEPAVVSIQTERFQRGFFGELRRAEGAGTGMVLTPDGDVLTNAHVVEGAQRIEVTFSGEKDPRPADLVGTAPAADVAVIKIRDATGLPTVKLGTSQDLVVGDDVIAIGNALALAGGLSVTQGIVSALNRTLEDQNVRFEDLIQTDAAINNGNSGGPLVNAAGEVVGINTVVIQQSGGNLVQNVGFAIAIDSVKPLIEQLRRGQTTQRTAFLGVTLQTLDADAAEQLGLDVDEGALILTVTEGSPAENAGLERFDVITRFGDEQVEAAEDVTTAVAEREPGDEVEVEFLRGGRTRTTTVTLGSRQVGR